jgi:hypothetical protein
MTDLATIRRAYRYVVAYERRILDVVSRVDDALLAAEFERKTPHRWYPLYTSFPSRDWPLEHWVWDRVPGYACRFEWLRGQPNRPGTRYVLADHVADTAFEDARRAGRGEPEPLASLESADASRSVLRWMLIELHAALPDELWRLSWRELLCKHFSVDQKSVFVNQSTEQPLRLTSDAVTVTAACVDLQALDDAKDFDDRFVQPLVKVLG